MSFSSEVDAGLEAVNGTPMHHFLADFEDLFDEEQFKALGINPAAPTQAKPGSQDKVAMLAARYAAGLPLWHDEDCYDHGPDGEDFDDDLDLND